MIFVFVWLTSLNVVITRSIHVVANGNISLFLWPSNILLYICIYNIYMYIYILYIQYIHTLATWCKELTHWKRPWCWERLKAGGEGNNRGWDGWMSSPTWWTWVWASWRVDDGQGGLMCCSPWDRKEGDMTELTDICTTSSRY